MSEQKSVMIYQTDIDMELKYFFKRDSIRNLIMKALENYTPN